MYATHTQRKTFQDCFVCLCSECVDLEHVQVKDCQMWVPELALFNSDKSILESAEWLNDNVIFAAMKLLEKQTKKKRIHGWQSTQNGKTWNFKCFILELSSFKYSTLATTGLRLRM